MSKITNLRAARKAEDRANKRAKADVNALKFGVSKEQKQRLTETLKKARAKHEAHRREPE